jgi:hypothetical protein
MSKTSKKPLDWRRKAVKRDKRIAIYLTGYEYVYVQESAKTAGLDFSTFIRGMTLRGQVKAKLTEEERRLFRDLVSMANDLHQLAKTAREGSQSPAASDFETCRNQIDHIFKNFTHDSKDF